MRNLYSSRRVGQSSRSRKQGQPTEACKIRFLILSPADDATPIGDVQCHRHALGVEGSFECPRDRLERCQGIHVFTAIFIDKAGKKGHECVQGHLMQHVYIKGFAIFFP